MDPGDLKSMDFEWLADLHKSQCFTTCEVSYPATSSDFGSDGYTVSVTDWHELLQLTAPDETCGLVFVRGDFPNTPDAILARAQRRDDTGGKGTFGTRLQIAELDTDLELGERRAQGWVNFRWPYTQYELKRKGDRWDQHTGTYEELSFVKDGVVFQIIRIKWGNDSSLSDYSDSADSQDKHTAKIRAGGVLRFGCPCSNRSAPDADDFKLSLIDDGKTLHCTSKKYQKRLEMQLLINGNTQNICGALNSLEDDEIKGIEVDTSSIHHIELSVGDPTYIISTYALRSSNVHKVDNMAYFDDLEDYLGIANTSINMTDRLWTALCSVNYEASEAVEISVVARSVEQILGVSSVPFSNLQRCEQAPSDGEFQKKNSLEELRGTLETALVCNIITPQYVDVQSAFFQIRLLLKVYSFISARHFEPDLLWRFRLLDDIRDCYLEKLRGFIRSCLVWLISTNMKPGRLLLALRSSEEGVELETKPSQRLQQCEKNRVGMVVDQSYNQACYATLAVWHTMKHCPQVITDDFLGGILLPKLRRAYESVQKRASRNKEPTPKNDVLQWLHLSSLYLIYNWQLSANENGEPIDGFMACGIDRQEFLRTQQKFEKYVSRLKTSQIETYSIEHEELDRVILLAEELGLDAIPTHFTLSLASSRVVQTRKRIAERKRTTSFNPGPKVWQGQRVTSNGPWELLCTNHASFLRVADDSTVRAARDRLFEFMMSDYSFMSSWDHADSGMIGSWWDFEPASVVCAILIDLKSEGKLRSAMSEKAMEEMNQSSYDLLQNPENGENQLVVEEPQQEKSIREILLQMKQIQKDSSREQLAQMRQLLIQEEFGANLDVKVFDWVTCKPDKLFHPEWWVQSLEDTPEVYQAKQTKNVPLRKDIRRYLSSRDRHDIIEDPEYTVSNITKKIAAEDLQFLSIFDLYLTQNFTFQSKQTSIPALTTRSISRDILANGAIDDNIPRRQGKPAIKEARQDSVMYSIDELELYRKILFSKLNDSLIDIGAKHRILFVEKCSPSLVGSFIYMWHPDALDTFDSYFGTSSRFAENREALMWTTSITLSHWSIRPTSLSKAHHEIFNESRNNGDFPPVSIATLGATKKHINAEARPQTEVVEERSSSLVITGDPYGYLWICSIWSSLTDSESISLPIDLIPKILQRFIHQQACGRCLVFLVLLGHLCEKLAGEYEEILSRLDVIVGLGEKVLLEGLEWGTSEAVNKLKKMLWGLEALRVFDDRLSGSLSQIQKAQGAMERTIKQEAGQQHVDLLQEHNNVIEEFEKRYGMLSDVQIRTQLKIRQVAGFRDGISTVTNVEDSQTALRDSQTTIRQGNNIRILTYITIAYLPLGFVTGLFSISHAPFMDSAGNVVFAVLVLIFILGTYTLALSLETIIKQWSRLRQEKWGTKKLSINPPKREDTELKLSFNALGSCCGFRRRYTSDEMDNKISQAA